MGTGAFGGDGRNVDEYSADSTNRFATDNSLLVELSKRLDITKSDATFLVDQVIESIMMVTSKNGACKIRKLGTFKLQTRKRCRIYNPTLKEYIVVPMKYLVRFKPTVGFKAMANSRVKDNLKTYYEIKENKI